MTNYFTAARDIWAPVILSIAVNVTLVAGAVVVALILAGPPAAEPETQPGWSAEQTTDFSGRKRKRSAKPTPKYADPMPASVWPKLDRATLNAYAPVSLPEPPPVRVTTIRVASVEPIAIPAVVQESAAPAPTPWHHTETGKRSIIVTVGAILGALIMGTIVGADVRRIRGAA